MPKNKVVQETKKVRSKTIRQSESPLYSLEDSLAIPQAIWDEFAGSPTTPILVAQALNISPSSSKWRDLTGAAIAYGLTVGGYNASQISLTELGKRIVSPLVEGDELLAKRDAALIPSFHKKFYEQYKSGSKMPSNNIAQNVLVSWGLPKEKSQSAYDIIKSNGMYVGIIITIKGNEYVELNSTSTSPVENVNDSDSVTDKTIIPDSVLNRMNICPPNNGVSNKSNIEEINNKVFISHGKNKQIVEQLKQLLEYGSFEPIVSVEREATAIPVPDKVFDDMRQCSAGVIHVEGESKLLDKNGNEVEIVNQNVLIEIGAAIALYKGKVILLCKEGTKLPSNLQGLYRCEYVGEQLDYNATMKLLKTFSEFKNK